MGTRILLLADCNSAHTKKWALGLSRKGFKVGIFSFTLSLNDWYSNEGIVLLNSGAMQPGKSGVRSKLQYLGFLGELRRQLAVFNPDVLHAHYASSYGLLGALSGFAPFIISAWGTDVMRFPQKSFLHRAILSFNLRKADAICATSPTIARYIKFFSSKPVMLVPFGVDTTVFKPLAHPERKKEVFTISCAKALEPMYNIHVLLRAFYQLKQQFPHQTFKLVVMGDGSEKERLLNLTATLNLLKEVVFTGKVPAEEVASRIADSDLVMNLSEYESFGVNIIEAMACRVPVIVSEAEGLRHLAEQAPGNLVVNTRNGDEIVGAMRHFFQHPEARKKAGESGFQLVNKYYTLDACLRRMTHVYDEQIHARLLHLALEEHKKPVLH